MIDEAGRDGDGEVNEEGFLSAFGAKLRHLFTLRC